MSSELSSRVVRRSLTVWGLLGCAFFALAAILTWRVVAAEPPGASPLVRIALLLPAAVAADQERLRALTAAFEFTLRDEPGGTGVRFGVPMGTAARLLFDDLRGDDACTIAPTPVDPGRVRITSLADYDARVSLIAVDFARPIDPLAPARSPGDRPWHVTPPPAMVTCHVRRAGGWENFVTRDVAVGAPSLPQKLVDRAGVRDYRAAPFVYLAFPGGDGLSFNGGHTWLGDVTVAAPERRRIVDRDATVDVSWRDLERESWRDAIFVIVGAFIALAAAMWIEGARPIIDAYIDGRMAERTAPGPAPIELPEAEIPQPKGDSG